MNSLDRDDFSCARFSTEDFPPDDRVARLREIMRRRLRIEIEPVANRPFHLEVALRTLPDLRIISTYTHGAHAQRTNDLIGDGNDCFCLAVMSVGTGVIQSGRQQITIEHGDATLLSAAETFSIMCPAMSRCLVVSIPSATLALLAANIDDAVMRPISRSTEALKLLEAYLGLLRQQFDLSTPDLRRHVSGHIHDLVALAVGAVSEVAEAAQDRSVRAARLRAIKADVIDNFARADLSIDWAAARHGVTPRYVRKLFESDGKTFSEFIVAQRLARAHSLLTDPRFSDQAISAIAFECGFGDLSYFNRTFRRVYDAAPTDVRAPAKLDEDKAG